MNISSPDNWFTTAGSIAGSGVQQSFKTIGQLKNIFLDETARSRMDQSRLVYSVSALLPAAMDMQGSLFFGTTCIEPGTVQEEYFMTQGHFHQVSDRAEYYWAIQGTGVLILMNRDRSHRAEIMSPGSIHHIPPHTAHRVANTGSAQLTFGACWPSDAGHDYEEIITNGFSCRLLHKNGKPQLITI